MFVRDWKKGRRINERRKAESGKGLGPISMYCGVKTQTKGMRKTKTSVEKESGREGKQVWRGKEQRGGKKQAPRPKRTGWDRGPTRKKGTVIYDTGKRGRRGEKVEDPSVQNPTEVKKSKIGREDKQGLRRQITGGK